MMLQVKKVFEKVDILITPATAATAARFNTPDGKEDVDIESEGLMMRYCFLGNFTGTLLIRNKKERRKRMRERERAKENERKGERQKEKEKA